MGVQKTGGNGINEWKYFRNKKWQLSLRHGRQIQYGEAGGMRSSGINTRWLLVSQANHRQSYQMKQRVVQD